MKHAACLVVAAFVVPAAVAAPPVARTLTFDERVAAQKAIEQVYWNHRLWPKENPTPKPLLSAVMSDDAIRAKVEDSLKKSAALEKYWRRPITGEQLQAEMDRMAKHTRDGRTLSELFAALANDPVVIAETLARPVLADRLTRSWYASDTRFRPANVARPAASFDTWWSAERAALPAGTTTAPAALPLIVPAVSGCVNDTWDLMASAIEPRGGHSAVWTGAEMITWGGGGDGSSGPSLLNSGSRYHPATDTWEATSTGANVPVGRGSHTAVWTGTQMIVWGGYDGTNKRNDGGRYDPSTDSWLPTSGGANVPEARFVHTAVWTGTEMIVWGGYANSTHVDTGGRYNPVTDSWAATSVGANTPEARVNHTAVWTGTEMIVWGGQHFTASVNSGGRYNPTTDSWTSTSTGANVPEQRIGHTAVWTGTEMIVWGGNDADFFTGTNHWLNSGGRYNPSTNTWSATSAGANVAVARAEHTAVWTGTEMIIWGGRENYVVIPESGGRYNPSTDSWQATSTGANVPNGRYGDTAVWTGTEMIIWGGAERFAVNTGGRYNPSTDSWVATSTGDYVPEPRKLHTAVWIGDAMIVWGGRGFAPESEAPLWNSGGRYDPATDSWTPTSLGANVPDPREQHTAVWTGTEMIVYGGAPYAVSDTGGRYNPSTDTWLAISGSSAPSGRFHHGAVWTGSEMIVWGGDFDDIELNTGGRYNPSTNAWAATSTGANLPAGRHFHSVVWTGTQMIVWGGLSGTDVNTGGRYTPSTNSWAATSTGANAPSAREQHTALWTGTAMIVWGGLAGSVTNTGGRYDPSANTWVATSTGANVPEARSGHTSVWTGREMVAWGGGLSTGGRYNPSSDSWAPTSLGQYVPVGRSDSTAVWTGREMIVWGGGSDDQALNVGGRYCACLDPVTYYRDADGDGRGDAATSSTACNGVIPAGYVAGNTDCNDAAAGVWSIPTETRSVSFSSQATLGWTTPTDPGGSAPLYDTIRSNTASNFSAGGTCVESNGNDTTTTDAAQPALGAAFYYLVRAETSCGAGSLGQATGGIERSGRICP